MISYIRESFGRILDNLPWMDAETKTQAKKKLEKMDQFIAYPDELTDQESVDGLHKGTHIYIVKVSLLLLFMTRDSCHLNTFHSCF